MKKRISFKETYPEISRLQQSGEIFENYDDTIPIIIEKGNDSKLKEFDRKRFFSNPHYK